MGQNDSAPKDMAQEGAVFMNGKIRNTINARQIKAARALLDWSQDRLAEACGLSIATIRKIESGHISPRNSTMGGIQRALEGAGLEFIDPNGVRERPEEIKIYEGRAQLKEFYDDVYETTKRSGKEVVMVCRDANTIFANMLDEDFKMDHRKKMLAISGAVSVKCLLTESKTSAPAPEYCEYRFLPYSFLNSIPFYLYGDKCSFRLLSRSDAPRIIIIESRELADTFRQQFDSMWDKAVPVSVPQKEDRLDKKKNR